MARGYQITGDQRYLEAARKNARFVTATLYRDGRLIHSYRDGVSSDGRFLEDYSYYVRGLLDLYESDAANDNHRWIDLALSLTDRALDLFFESDGTFYLREAGQQDLIVRPKDELDGALPAPGSIMAANLIRLSRITGTDHYLSQATTALERLSGYLAPMGGSMASALLALDYLLGDKVEIVLVGEGPERTAMMAEIFRRFIPNRVVAVSADGSSEEALFAGRRAEPGEVRAYVCLNSVCKLPVTDLESLSAQLDATL
jgi:uncharacterized protein YyaL (SSP411 family)